MESAPGGNLLRAGRTNHGFALSLPPVNNGFLFQFQYRKSAAVCRNYVYLKLHDPLGVERQFGNHSASTQEIHLSG
jgi:hypothetical protein